MFDAPAAAGTDLPAEDNRGNVLFVDQRLTSPQFQSSLEISQNLKPWKGKLRLEFRYDFEEFYTRAALNWLHVGGFIGILQNTKI